MLQGLYGAKALIKVAKINFCNCVRNVLCLQNCTITGNAGRPSTDDHCLTDDIHHQALTTDSTGGAGDVDTGPCSDVVHMSCDASHQSENTDSAGGDLSMSCDAVMSSGDSMPEGDKVAELHAVLQHISPMPKCKTVRQRKRTTEHAEVLTASPFKKRLLEKESSKVSCPMC